MSYAVRPGAPLVFKPMLMKVGMHRLRAALTAGAPIPPTVQALWQIWGVNLRNLYGITEHTLVLCQASRFPHPGDAGVPLYPKEVRLGDDGEILVRGPGMFAGYWQNEAATKEAVRDGWFHTGDVAERMANGHFRIVDRKKDIMVTGGGKNIAPSEIENVLKASPYHQRGRAVRGWAEIPERSRSRSISIPCRDWARHHGVVYTGFTSLAQHPRVMQLIAREIAEDQRAARAGRAGQEIPHHAEGTRSRRRATRRRPARSSAATCTCCSRISSKRCTGTTKKPGSKWKLPKHRIAERLAFS